MGAREPLLNQASCGSHGVDYGQKHYPDTGKTLDGSGAETTTYKVTKTSNRRWRHSELSPLQQASCPLTCAKETQRVLQRAKNQLTKAALLQKEVGGQGQLTILGAQGDLDASDFIF